MASLTKKALVFVSIFLLAITLVGCSNNATDTPANSQSEETSEVKEQEKEQEEQKEKQEQGQEEEQEPVDVPEINPSDNPSTTEIPNEYDGPTVNDVINRDGSSIVEELSSKGWKYHDDSDGLYESEDLKSSYCLYHDSWRNYFLEEIQAMEANAGSVPTMMVILNNDSVFVSLDEAINTIVNVNQKDRYEFNSKYDNEEVLLVVETDTGEQDIVLARHYASGGYTVDVFNEAAAESGFVTNELTNYGLLDEVVEDGNLVYESGTIEDVWYYITGRGIAE